MQQFFIPKILAVTSLLLAASPSLAGGVNWSIGVSVPAPVVSYSAAPVVVVQAQPVYVVEREHVYMSGPHSPSAHGTTVIEYRRSYYPTQVYQPVYVVQPAPVAHVHLHRHHGHHRHHR